ncbi:MAG: SpoIIE family protein phosphatase [Deltaproteobacteria bacterium]|jgi:sigma-B regulation protein RsbU (phosphoserine phosphatase)|nr:SpoIIE family protein phosphatase [Deltaproteobacteria bacterium]
MTKASAIPVWRRLAARQAAPILAGLGLLLGVVLFYGHHYLRENILQTAQDQVRQVSAVAGSVFSLLQRWAEEKNAAVAGALEEMPPDKAALALGRNSGTLDRVLLSLLTLEETHRRFDIAFSAGEGRELAVSYARGAEGQVLKTALWQERAKSFSWAEKSSAGDRRSFQSGFFRAGWATPVSSPADEDGKILMRYTTPLVWAAPDGAVRSLGRVCLTVSMDWLTPLMDSMAGFENLDSFILSSEGIYLISRDISAIGPLPELSARLGEPALETLGGAMLAGEQGSMVIPWGGADRLALYMPVAAKGLSLAMLIPEETLSRPLKMLGRQIIVLTLGLIVLTAAGLYGVTKATLRPVRALLNMAGRLSRGDFAADPPPARKRFFPAASADPARLAEPGRLIRAANSLRLALEQRLGDLTLAAAARERLTSELALARDIQEGVRPRVLPQAETLELAALLRGFHPVNSTLYDAFFRSGRSLCCVLVDVVAQGIPAALFMGRVMPLLRETLLAGGPPGRSLETVNKILLIGKNKPEPPIFAHILAGTLDSVSGVFAWAGAGPSLPVFLRGGRAAILNSAREDPLGLRPDSSFPTRSLRLLPGDALFLATDGLGLVRSPEGVAYRQSRLLAFISARDAAQRLPSAGEEKAAGAAAEDLLRAVLEDAAEHAAPDSPGEDAALLMLRWKGPRRRDF